MDDSTTEEGSFIDYDAYAIDSLENIMGYGIGALEGTLEKALMEYQIDRCLPSLIVILKDLIQTFFEFTDWWTDDDETAYYLSYDPLTEGLVIGDHVMNELIYAYGVYVYCPEYFGFVEGSENSIHFEIFYGLEWLSTAGTAGMTYLQLVTNDPMYVSMYAGSGAG